LAADLELPVIGAPVGYPLPWSAERCGIASRLAFRVAGWCAWCYYGGDERDRFWQFGRGDARLSPMSRAEAGFARWVARKAVTWRHVCSVGAGGSDRAEWLVLQAGANPLWRQRPGQPDLWPRHGRQSV